jgi:serine/threonine protein kinase
MILARGMPATLGPYQLVRLLGRGGMAEVHLAVSHGASGFARHVAIKTLMPDLAIEHALERALIREATVGARLHHRNLVAIEGLGVADGRYYVVMEYVDGGDLATLIDAGGSLGEALALHVVGELALGLAYVHDARDDHDLPLGLVHRDVGPANVLVSTSGDVKLADFGIAKATALADLTAAGARRGTYAYMSPEQLAGDPLDATSDQFGLAVLLVELVTGSRPFVGDTPWATMEAIQHGEARLAGLALDVVAVVGRALAIDREDRYRSMLELRDAVAVLQRARPAVGPVELARWVVARGKLAR